MNEDRVSWVLREVEDDEADTAREGGGELRACGGALRHVGLPMVVDAMLGEHGPDLGREGQDATDTEASQRGDHRAGRASQ